MKPIDIILIVILVLIFSSIFIYIKTKKKQGVKCIGCPFAKECRSKENCNNR